MTAVHLRRIDPARKWAAFTGRETPQHGDRNRVRHVAAQTRRSGFDGDSAGGEGVIGDDTLLFTHDIGA